LASLTDQPLTMPRLQLRYLQHHATILPRDPKQACQIHTSEAKLDRLLSNDRGLQV